MHVVWNTKTNYASAIENWQLNLGSLGKKSRATKPPIHLGVDFGMCVTFTVEENENLERKNLFEDETKEAIIIRVPMVHLARMGFLFYFTKLSGI